MRSLRTNGCSTSTPSHVFMLLQLPFLRRGAIPSGTPGSVGCMGGSSHPVVDLFLRQATARWLYQDPDQCGTILVTFLYVRIVSSAHARKCVSFTGKESCRVDFHKAEDNEDEVLARYHNQSMIFEPALGGSDSRCSCESIDR